MKFTELSDSELEVMKVLWEKGEPMSFGELLDYFNVHTKKEETDAEHLFIPNAAKEFIADYNGRKI